MDWGIEGLFACLLGWLMDRVIHWIWMRCLIIAGVSGQNKILTKAAENVESDRETRGNGIKIIVTGPHGLAVPKIPLTRTSESTDTPSLDPLCIICKGEATSTAFTPWGHRNFCQGCAQTAFKVMKECPYCRSATTALWESSFERSHCFLRWVQDSFLGLRFFLHRFDFFFVKIFYVVTSCS